MMLVVTMLTAGVMFGSSRRRRKIRYLASSVRSLCTLYSDFVCVCVRACVRACVPAFVRACGGIDSDWDRVSERVNEFENILEEKAQTSTRVSEFATQKRYEDRSAIQFTNFITCFLFY